MITRQNIFQLKGELAVLKKEFEDLDIAGNNALITILNKLSPDAISEDILDLDLRGAEVEFKQLQRLVQLAGEKKERILKLEKQLQDIQSALA